MGDRIAVLQSGRLQQLGSPMDLYTRPANRFVASFIGTPSMNFIEGRIDGGSFEGDGLKITLDDRSLPGGPTVLGVRPEHVEVVPDDDATVVAAVDVVEPTGSETLLYTDASGLALVVRVVGSACPSAGERVGLRFDAESVRFFCAETGIALN